MRGIHCRSTCVIVYQLKPLFHVGDVPPSRCLPLPSGLRRRGSLSTWQRAGSRLLEAVINFSVCHTVQQNSYRARWPHRLVTSLPFIRWYSRWTGAARWKVTLICSTCGSRCHRISLGERGGSSLCRRGSYRLWIDLHASCCLAHCGWVLCFSHLLWLWVQVGRGLDELSVRKSQALAPEIKLGIISAAKLRMASGSISDSSSLEAVVDDKKARIAILEREKERQRDASFPWKLLAMV